MKFVISRTSSSDLSEKPCEEAFECEYLYADSRGVDDPAKIPAYRNCPHKWYEEGQNHRVVGGSIVRDVISKGWCVEISNLDEILAFQRKRGLLILSLQGETPSIEIYDDYRE